MRESKQGEQPLRGGTTIAPVLQADPSTAVSPATSKYPHTVNSTNVCFQQGVT